MLSLHVSFNDLGVYLGYSVDSMRSHNAQVSHVDSLTAVFFNQRHSPDSVPVLRKLGCNILQGGEEYTQSPSLQLIETAKENPAYRPNLSLEHTVKQMW